MNVAHNSLSVHNIFCFKCKNLFRHLLLYSLSLYKVFHSAYLCLVRLILSISCFLCIIYEQVLFIIKNNPHFVYVSNLFIDSHIFFFSKLFVGGLSWDTTKGTIKFKENINYLILLDSMQHNSERGIIT